ncbi:MAG: hypothetical protein IJX63_07100 [Lachnospiraceae bacterium]|nr:hypothetical protein [Lachnospiraceae bacterium]
MGKIVFPDAFSYGNDLCIRIYKKLYVFRVAHHVKSLLMDTDAVLA